MRSRPASGVGVALPHVGPKGPIGRPKRRVDVGMGLGHGAQSRIGPDALHVVGPPAKSAVSGIGPACVNLAPSPEPYRAIASAFATMS